MSDPTPTPVPQSLIVELIKSISANTEELHKLRAEVAQLAHEKRALMRDVACMSRGITEFKEQFGPYLSRAVEDEKLWLERRRSLMTAVLKWGLMGALSFVLWSSWEHVVEMVRHK